MPVHGQPEVAVAGGRVYVRWPGAIGWAEVGPAAPVPHVAELPEAAARLAGMPLNPVVGQLLPPGGAAGDCPVSWRVLNDDDCESWWCCTLPRGHAGTPHMAASYGRVDAILDGRTARLRLVG